MLQLCWQCSFKNAKVRGKGRLFAIKKKRIAIWETHQETKGRGSMRKGRGTVRSTERRHYYRCRLANMVTLILNNVFHFQSSSRNIYFLVTFANSSLGLSVALGPAQRLFCPVLMLPGFEE